MQISDARVLIVATDGFEEWELFGPRQILQQRGAEVVLASLKRDPIQATIHDDPGKTIRPDLTDRRSELRRFRCADPAWWSPQSRPTAYALQRDCIDSSLRCGRTSPLAPSAMARGCSWKPTCCAGRPRPAGPRSERI